MDSKLWFKYIFFPRDVLYIENVYLKWMQVNTTVLYIVENANLATKKIVENMPSTFHQIIWI